jgi:hypothetical protein
MTHNLSQLETIWNQAPVVHLHCDSHTRTYVGVNVAHLKGGLGWCNCKAQLPVELRGLPEFKLCSHQVSYGKLLVMGCTFLDYANLVRGILPFDKQVTFELGLTAFQIFKLLEFQKVWAQAIESFAQFYKNGDVALFRTFDKYGRYISNEMKCNCLTAPSITAKCSHVNYPVIYKICQHSLAVRLKTHPDTWYEYIEDLRF